MRAGWRCYLLILILAGCARPPGAATPAATAVAAVRSELARDPGGAPTPIPAVGDTPEPPDAEPAPATPAGTPAAAASLAGTVPAPEFPAGLDWLNTDRPLTLADLRGKVVLLDFWTYGCINCLHVIPELKRLEAKYADELVVIGVHSAKFSTEAETDNIRQIIQRYELAHPVINDRDFVVWNSYGAGAWPTFVLIDPAGNVLGYHAGEGIYDLFDGVIGGMVAAFDARGEIDRTPLSLRLETADLANSPLLFPAKVLADAAGDRLFIADTNHNRIVVTTLDGVVQAVIGSGIAGFGDGTFAEAQFFRPHGLTLADADTLYVADTANHAIRRVRLDSGTVETVAGTGRQAAYQATQGRGTSIGLNSPWDVHMFDGRVIIAMAGQHQLWQYDPAAEIVGVYAGSGREALTDGSFLTASFNQPSGVAVDGERLFVADSEASAIRIVQAGSGVRTVVGTGLFAFGDVDGVGEDVRLQHPQGIAAGNGRVFIADTYNHKIKLLDPDSGAVRTLLGAGVDGWRDGVAPLFDEPGGVSLAGERLFIADTNNHVIRTADLATGRVETLVLIDRDGLLTRAPAGAPYRGILAPLPPQAVVAGAGSLRLDVTLPPGYKLNAQTPLIVTFRPDGHVKPAAGMLQLSAPTFPVDVPAAFAPGEARLQVDLVIPYCEAETERLCLLAQVRLVAPILVGEAGESVVSLPYTLLAPSE